LIYDLKLDLFILTTLVYSSELLTDLSDLRLQQSGQTTTLPARAYVTMRMGDFMLGNLRMKLPDINYVGTC